MLQHATQKPKTKPARPFFSSGPCVKRPGWSPDVLRNALSGRSHRSAEGRAQLKSVIETTRAVLHVPDDYEIAILPGSDTGAFECALWNLLGPHGVDVFAWEVFGRVWLKDVIDELGLAGVRTFDADWGYLPDLRQADFSRDVIFTWNGTTSGVRVPDGKWIAADRTGLTFCDATSAVFAQAIDFSKIDVLTFSWQKALGGEAGHGMLILSPRAMYRLESFHPSWPVPKVLRLKSPSGEVMHDVFEGVTVNTPSMLCVEDYLDALAWIEKIGGLKAAIARADANAKVIYDWIARTPWAEPLAVEAATRSNTSVCIRFADAEVLSRGHEAVAAFLKDMTELLAANNAAFDIAAYRGVTPGLRIWTGTTVERQDLIDLIPWLDWAYAAIKARNSPSPHSFT